MCLYINIKIVFIGVHVTIGSGSNLVPYKQVIIWNYKYKEREKESS